MKKTKRLTFEEGEKQGVKYFFVANKKKTFYDDVSTKEELKNTMSFGVKDQIEYQSSLGEKGTTPVHAYGMLNGTRGEVSLGDRWISMDGDDQLYFSRNELLKYGDDTLVPKDNLFLGPGKVTFDIPFDHQVSPNQQQSDELIYNLTKQNVDFGEDSTYAINTHKRKFYIAVEFTESRKLSDVQFSPGITNNLSYTTRILMKGALSYGTPVPVYYIVYIPDATHYDQQGLANRGFYTLDALGLTSGDGSGSSSSNGKRSNAVSRNKVMVLV
jgi:hypothetical protein